MHKFICVTYMHLGDSKIYLMVLNIKEVKEIACEIREKIDRIGRFMWRLSANYSDEVSR